MNDTADQVPPRPPGTLRIGAADVVAADTLRIGAADVVAPPVEPVLQFFGDYTVLGEIAKGGMGVVYLARHRKLNRTVALKMIRAGGLAKEEEVRRFRVEAEAAANLDHPNIVPIYELGEHEGRHYFSMKMVAGESLHDFNARRQPHERGLDWLRNSAMLLVKISRAVQHAHERAILHRDLKPRNILIDENGEPHVTDFGLAKVLGQAAAETLADVIMGTPHYMSPEQAAGKTRDVTTAADVYSLGAVLFELLVGTPPFKGDTMMRVIQQVRETPPPNPMQLNPAVPRDLATVCLKCLEKEPQRRYASAGALADELERWLAGEPILARPATLPERAVKWVKRNPRLAFALGLAMLSALVAVTGITWQWQRAEKQSAERRRIGERLEIQRAEDYFTAHHASAALATLARVLRDNPANHVASARLVNALNHRPVLVPVESAGAGVTAAAFTGDDAVLITGTNATGSVVTLRRGNSPEKNFLYGTAQILSAKLSPDGRTLATGGEGGLRLWNVTDGSLLGNWFTNHSVLFVAFAPGAEGESAVGVTTDRVVLVRAGAAREIATGHADVMLAAQSQDRRRLALATEAGHLLVRDLAAEGEWLVISNAHAIVIRALAFGGDEWLVSASADRRARIWNARTGRGEPAITNSATILHAEFSADSLALVTADRDGTVQQWNTLTRRATGPALRHPAAVNAARYSPDGRQLVTGCDDGITRLWSAGTGELLAQTGPGRRQIIDVSFSRNGKTILSVADSSPAFLYAPLGGSGLRPVFADAATLKAFATKATEPPAEEMKIYSAGHFDEVTFADLSPDGALAATASADRTARLWRRATRGPLTDPLPHDALVNCVRFSADGRLLATSTASAKVRVWDAATGQPVTDSLTARDPAAQVWLTGEPVFVVTDERQVWPVYSARESAPAWLPEMAEALAGARLNEQRVMEPVPGGALAALRPRLLAHTQTNALSTWAAKLFYELPGANR